MNTPTLSLPPLAQRLRLGSAHPRLTMIAGDASIHRLLLASLLLRLPRTIPLLILDGGNVFEGFFLTRLAKMLGRSPRPLLSRMKIARTFTAYQTENAILSLENGLLSRPSIVLCLDLLATFYDEQIPLIDAERKLRRMGETLRHLYERGGQCFLTIPDRPELAGRRHFPHLLKSYTTEHFILHPRDHGSNPSLLHAAH